MLIGANQKVRVLEVGCLTKKVTGMTQARRSAAKKSYFTCSYLVKLNFYSSVTNEALIMLQ